MEREAVSVGIGGLNVSKEEVKENAYFDGFNDTELEVSSVRGHTCYYRPVTTGDTRIQFVIPADPDKFIDPASFRLKGKMKIQKRGANGELENLDDEDEVSTCNNAIQSCFERVNFKLDGTLFGDPTGGWYAYKAFIELLLSYSKAGKKVSLRHKLWIPDKEGKHDSLATAAVRQVVGGGGVDPVAAQARTPSDNDGYETRRNLFTKSNYVYFRIPIHSDVCTMKAHIPPNVKIEVDFVRQKDKFVLLTPDTNTEFKIVFEDVQLVCVKQEHTAEVRKYYFDNLKSGKKYRTRIDRSIFKEYTIAQGQFNLSSYNIIRGDAMPGQMILFMVKEKAQFGDLKENPFNFHHYHMSEASFLYNGIHEPLEKVEMDLGYTDNANTWNLKSDGEIRGDCVDCYQHFLDNIGIGDSDEEIGIGMEEFFQGNFFIPNDRSPEKCNRYHEHYHPGGVMGINLHVKKALPHNVHVMLYSTYGTEIIFDNGTVHKNEKIEI